MLYAINGSKQFMRDIGFSFIADRQGYSHDEVRQMGHEFWCTRADKMIEPLTERFFSTHYGKFLPSGKFTTEGQFAGMPREKVSSDAACRQGVPMCYTFWLASDFYKKDVHIIPVTQDLVTEIKREISQYA